MNTNMANIDGRPNSTESMNELRQRVIDLRWELAKSDCFDSVSIRVAVKPKSLSL